MAAADPTNPQSWNRYAYVLNRPLSFVDPLGLCDEPTYSYTDKDGALHVVGSHPCPCPGNNGYGIVDGMLVCGPPGQVLSAINAYLGSFSASGAWNSIKSTFRTIGKYVPVPCGGGGFAYGGGRLTGGYAAAGVYGIIAADSRTGISKGVFTDVTIGEGLQAGHGTAVYTDHSSEQFLFVGAGEDLIIEKASVSGYVSHVRGDSLLHNQIGLNVDVGTQGGGFGLGLGVNTDSLTSCVDHNFR